MNVGQAATTAWPLHTAFHPLLTGTAAGVLTNEAYRFQADTSHSKAKIQVSIAGGMAVDRWRACAEHMNGILYAQHSRLPC